MPLKDPPITVDAERFCQLAEDIMIAIRKATDPAGLKMFVRVSPNQTARGLRQLMTALSGHLVFVQDWEKLTAPIILSASTFAGRFSEGQCDTLTPQPFGAMPRGQDDAIE